MSLNKPLQLSQVAFGRPRLQLEAGLYRLSGSHHLAWMLSRGRAPNPVAQLRASAEATLLHLSHTGCLAGAMTATSPGGQSSCGPTRWSNRSQLQGRQPESSRGSTQWRPGMQRALFNPLQVVRSSDGLDFPWMACPAAGLRSGPPGNGSSQGRQSKPRA
jgi:hypothetical protein